MLVSVAAGISTATASALRIAVLRAVICPPPVSQNRRRKRFVRRLGVHSEPEAAARQHHYGALTASSPQPARRQHWHRLPSWPSWRRRRRSQHVLPRFGLSVITQVTLGVLPTVRPGVGAGGRVVMGYRQR